MRKGKVLLVLVCVAVVLTAVGCKTTMIGPEGKVTATYSLGTLSSIVAKDVGSVYAAVEKAMEKLELSVTTKTKDAMSARIIARDSLDKKIVIRLLATPDNTTKLIVRVGTMGDEAKSRLIYQKIQDNLY